MKLMAQTLALLLPASSSRSTAMRLRALGLKVEQAIKHRTADVRCLNVALEQTSHVRNACHKQFRTN